MLHTRADPLSAGSRRKLIVFAGIVVLLAAIAGIMHSRRAPPQIAVLTVRYAPFTVQLPETGIVQYPQIQTLSSQVAATVGHVYARPGKRVRAGQLLATIENPQISSAAQSTAAAYRSATAHAASAQVNGGANVVQAQANLEGARARLAQAQQDLENGLQSGLGYGDLTAADERAQADATLVTTRSTLREAKRVYVADRELYTQKAISRDELDTAEAKFEQAQAAYDQANLQRSSLGTQLVRSRAVLQDNLRSAQQGFAQAQAQLAAAREQSAGGDVAAAQADASRAAWEYAFAKQQADAMQIRAPYDAIVLSIASEKNDPGRPLQPGDAIDVGQPVVSIAAQRGFIVRSRVDEQDAIDVRLGQRVLISGADFPGQTLSGRVVEVSPVAIRSGDASSTSRAVPVTIAIDRAAPFLRDGMTVDVNVLTTNSSRAIVVPNDAIANASGGTYVYVLREGTPRPVRVQVGPSDGSRSVVESGLRPGDVIAAQAPNSETPQ